jgi:tRNA nucleotidyltransferase (CCA-adding enzyme)
LEQIMEEEEPELALCRLDGLGVLREIHPKLRCGRWLSSRFRAIREEFDPASWDLRNSDVKFIYFGLLFYRLDPESLDEVIDRLKISHSDADEMVSLPDLRRVLRRLGPTRRPSSIYAILQPYPVRALAVAWVASERAGLRAKLLRYQTELRHIEPALTGDDLKGLGLEPGPLFGRLLSELRDARLDGQASTREEELVLLMRILDREGAGN